jgi:carboxypeptidase C (cathepsin A)
MKQILLCLLAFSLSTLYAEEEKLFSQTTHQALFDSGPLTYTATVASLPLLNKKNEKTGELYYISYRKEGEEDPSTRPLTFIFNGGPGSSSVWLHMGAFGPKRILNA